MESERKIEREREIMISTQFGEGSIKRPSNSVGAETNVHNSQEAIIDIKI